MYGCKKFLVGNLLNNSLIVQPVVCGSVSSVGGVAAVPIVPKALMLAVRNASAWRNAAAMKK